MDEVCLALDVANVGNVPKFGGDAVLSVLDGDSCDGRGEDHEGHDGEHGEDRSQRSDAHLIGSRPAVFDAPIVRFRLQTAARTR